MSYLKEISPKMPRYAMAYRGLVQPGTPLNLTFSVTNLCQSRCKTCGIWRIYRDDPAKRQEELTTDEIEKIFRTLGHVYVFNISGGEPFLRKDLGEIIRLACRHLTPGIIHIPTNAIAADRIVEQTEAILACLERICPQVRLTVKPSLDHIGQKHDEIRGVAGNFEKVMALFRRLKALQADHPHFHAELGTVVSRWNVRDIEEIAAFVTRLGTDSYRNEIAEQRSEMLNLDDPITPDPDEYEAAIQFFVGQIKRNMKQRVLFQRITHAFRLAYYGLAIRILRENRQVIPCYAGISNAHMTPYGDIWACCTLGYDKPMGNLRKHGYDFPALWNSPRAREVRRYIREGRCACPMANQAYSNILMHPPSLVRVMGGIVGAG
ncbi:radical SAM/SPASM domain-containing protein [Desulfococcus sp.]|uniref:radical SAM protein n=1 Tax=Desulfococcus sp. TaxID=2025834 RepID=UPI0035937D32